jgi:uncharacterized protein
MSAAPRSHSDRGRCLRAAVRQNTNRRRVRLVVVGMRTLQLLSGCVVLGLGVTLLLAPALGSDGYSTLVNGLHLATGMPFIAANGMVSGAFVLLAWMRRLAPGPGTLVQIVVVGTVVTFALPMASEPGALWGRFVVLAMAFPVLAVGIAMYLGSHFGAGPAEAAALAWDPPIPFAHSYSVVQAGGALVGWHLGAAVGPGTVAIIFLLGPVVALTGRLLHLDVHQSPRR